MQFLLAMLLFSVALSNIQAQEHDQDSIRAIAEECKVETGATDDDVSAMFKHEALTTTEAKCMRACAMKKGGLLNDEGQMNKEALMQVTKLLAKGDDEKEKTGKEIVEECAKIELPEDHCDAAEAYTTCLRNLGEERGLTSMEFE